MRCDPRQSRSRSRATAHVAALLTVVLAALSPVAAAAETLREALAAAYRYNPRLDAERARLRAADEEIARANSGYRPQIFGQADVGFQNQNLRPDSLAEGRTNPKGFAINLNQNLFNGFQTTNAVREAEAGVRAGREALRQVEAEVLLEAATAYADVVRDQAIVRLQENNVNVLTRELKATEDRFKVGEVTRTDLAQAQARRAGAVSQLDAARANLKTSRAVFKRVVGHDPAGLAEPGTPDRLLPPSVDAAMSIGDQESPIVIRALYREQAARHTVDRIRGELLPELELDATYSNRYQQTNILDQNETTTVTGRLTVPIYQGGEVHARVRQAKHTHVSLLQEIEKSKTEVRQEVVRSWSELEAKRAQLGSDRTQVEANRTALQGVREEEKVGQRTVLDVLNAELELVTSEVQLERTRRDLVVAGYRVLSAIGRLDMEHMGGVAEVYDPSVHTDEVRRKWYGISITHHDGRREHLDVLPPEERRARPAK